MSKYPTLVLDNTKKLIPYFNSNIGKKIMALFILDVFIIICSVLVFFALAEFALLSFLDVYIRRYKEKEDRIFKRRVSGHQRYQVNSSKSHHTLQENFSYINGSRNNTRDNLLSLEDIQSAQKRNGNQDKNIKCFNWDTFLKSSRLYHNTLDYLHYIDSVSRKLFPLTFLICNIVYWTSYIYVL